MKIFWNPIDGKKIIQLSFFLSNLNWECFQLSFDIHIVYTSQKFRFFPYCSIKKWKLFFVRLIDFSSILQKSYGWLDVFQRLYRWIKMPAFIWDLFYFIWMRFGDIFAKCVILIPPHLIDRPKSPPWLGLNVLLFCFSSIESIDMCWSFQMSYFLSS